MRTKATAKVSAFFMPKKLEGDYKNKKYNLNPDTKKRNVGFGFVTLSQIINIHRQRIVEVTFSKDIGLTQKNYFDYYSFHPLATSFLNCDNLDEI